MYFTIQSYGTNLSAFHVIVALQINIDTMTMVSDTNSSSKMNECKVFYRILKMSYNSNRNRFPNESKRRHQFQLTKRFHFFSLFYHFNVMKWWNSFFPFIHSFKGNKLSFIRFDSNWIFRYCIWMSSHWRR